MPKIGFTELKEPIRAEFQETFSKYPTTFPESKDALTGDTPLEKRRSVYRFLAEYAPVRLFPHFPFYSVVDAGLGRYDHIGGIASVCYRESGVDFTPLRSFMREYSEKALIQINDYNDYFHRTLDYATLLVSGFHGIYDRAGELERECGEPSKREFYETVREGCLMVKRIGERFSAEASRLLENGEELDRISRDFLVRIRDTAGRIPWEKPETFYEAANTLLYTELIGHANYVSVNTRGHVDQLLFPYYESGIADGSLTREEAYTLLCCLLYETDAAYGTSGECGMTVMIGGQNEYGEPVCNELTRMIIRAYAENRFTNPKLNIRVCQKSPDVLFDDAAGLISLGTNVAAIENDESNVPALMRTGVSEKDARMYVGCGCQEIVARGQHHARAFTYINMPKILLGTLEHYTSDESFENLYSEFISDMRALVRKIAEVYRPYEQAHAMINPEPLVSALTPDCLENGRDMSDGGARYYYKTLSYVGFGTLCDSLFSLKEAYENSAEELGRLIDAVKDDFAHDAELQKRLLDSKKRYGNGGNGGNGGKSGEADAFAVRLARDLSQLTDGMTTGNGISWGGSLFVYYVFMWQGLSTGATPDGRPKNTTFSRGMSPSARYCRDVTSAALSAAEVAKVGFCDTAVFDIALESGRSGSDECRANAIAAYLKTCVGLRIPVIQISALDTAELREEMETPGTHPETVVRVCGYSSKFGKLDRRVQSEVISRAENGG